MAVLTAAIFATAASCWNGWCGLVTRRCLIVIMDSAIAEAGVERMKLAMRLSTRHKMVFVDRLGLSQREFQEQELVEHIAAEQIRVLDSGVNFDDTLSDVVGRIRGGHYSG